MRGLPIVAGSCALGASIERATARRSAHIPAEPVARDASAPIATVLPALAACSYWQSPTPSSCVSCVVTARTFPSGSCGIAFDDARSACQFACLTSDSCSQLVSSCPPSTACTTALDNYQGCIYDSCLSFCPLTE